MSAGQHAPALRPPLASISGLRGLFSACRQTLWLGGFERPCEAGYTEPGATQDVRGPVCTDVDPAGGGGEEEDQDSDPGWPVGPEQVDGSEQEDRAQDMPAGVGVGCAHIE